MTNGCNHNGSLATLSPSANEACGCVVTVNINDLSLYMDISVMDVEMDSSATCWPVVHVMGKYYMCVRKNTTHSTQIYMNAKDTLSLNVYNTQHDSVSVVVMLSGTVSVFMLSHVYLVF